MGASNRAFFGLPAGAVSLAVAGKKKKPGEVLPPVAGAEATSSSIATAKAAGDRARKGGTLLGAVAGAMQPAVGAGRAVRRSLLGF